MTVTIIGTGNIAGTQKLENVNYDLVSIKETQKRNGYKSINVRVENGKRAIVFSNGNYQTITVQDEETGRYLFKYSK